MSSERPKTGILVKFVPNTMMSLVGKVLHFFHLERIGEKAFEASHLIVTIDGAETELPMALEHAFACAPGPHSISVAMKSALSPSKDMSRYFNEASIDVTVPPDELVEVRYIPDNITTPVGGNAKLEI